MISWLDISAHSWKDSCTDCAFYFALAAISASGLALSICSIVSYVPPLAGGFGGIISLSTLITLAIHYTVKRRSESAARRFFHSLRGEESDVAQNDNPFSILGLTSTKNRKVVIQVPKTSSTALIDRFPDELFLKFFNHLDAHDLATVSIVSRKWYHIASDTFLWKNLCMEETILPFGMTLHDSDAKALIQQTSLLRRNVQRVPREYRISMPRVFTEPCIRGSKPDKPEFTKILKVNNLCFFYDWMRGSFQVWNADFRSYIIGKECKPGLRSMYIKRFGQTVYFIGDDRLQLRLTNAYVYPFDLNSNRFLPILEFPRSRTDESSRSIFEFGNQKAIFGCLEGQIIIWDLRYKGWEKHQRDSSDECMKSFSEDMWTEADEKEWKASFLKTDLVVERRLLSGIITKEEGALWQEENKWRRAYRHAIQNRIFLNGHTSRITALKAVDDFLFSCSADGILKQWDLTTKTCTQTIKTGVKGDITLLEVAGRYVFGRSIRIIYQWNFETGELVNQINLRHGHQFQIHGNLIFSFGVGEQAIMEIYDLSIKKCIKFIEFENIYFSSNFVIENSRVYLIGRNKKNRSSELVVWDFSSYL